MNADPRLVEVFNRVADDITAVCGDAGVRTAEPSTRPGDDPFMTAAWFPGGVNNGFKLWDRGSRGVEILTWSHDGDPASAKVHLRWWDGVEATLRAVLPAALTPDRAEVVAPSGGLPAARAADSPQSSARPSGPGVVAGPDGHPNVAGPVSRIREEATGPATPTEVAQ